MQTACGSPEGNLLFQGKTPELAQTEVFSSFQVSRLRLHCEQPAIAAIVLVTLIGWTIPFLQLMRCGEGYMPAFFTTPTSSACWGPGKIELLSQPCLLSYTNCENGLNAPSSSLDMSDT